MEIPADATRVQAWQPPIDGIREVFHATFAEHAYPLHTHDTWTLFIVDHGGIRYDLDRHARGAEPSMVSILPPHVVHDGRSASGEGFRNRVLYVETSVLPERLIGPAVDQPIVGGPDIRARVSALHDALACRDDLLEAELRFASLLDSVRARLGDAAADPSSILASELAERLRAYLDAHLFEQATIADAAAELGVGATQLARAFTSAFGIAPHRYVLGRRLDAARTRLLGGQPLADVAAEVGFCDQAHLTRRFRDFLGFTPGQFARSTLTPARH
jgi:AraC-like DNA-binding protein